MKRRRYDEKEDIENRLNSLIVLIGDKSTTSLEANLQGLADALEGDIISHKSQILSTILAWYVSSSLGSPCNVTCGLPITIFIANTLLLGGCGGTEYSVTQLPVKTPVYGTLVGLINAKNVDFGKDVVERVSANLESALAKRDIMQVKMLLRFLAELTNAHVLAVPSLISLVNQLIDRAHSSANGHFYVYAVLMMLPFVGAYLSRHFPQDLQRLIMALESYLADHKFPVNPLIAPYPTQEVQLI